MRVERGTRCKGRGVRKPWASGNAGWGGIFPRSRPARHTEATTAEGITDSHPAKRTPLISKGERLKEKDGNRFYGFGDIDEKTLSPGRGENRVELGTEALFTRPTQCLNGRLKIPNVKLLFIKSLKIAYISGLTKKEKNLEIRTRRYLPVSK